MPLRSRSRSVLVAVVFVLTVFASLGDSFAQAGPLKNIAFMTDLDVRDDAVGIRIPVEFLAQLGYKLGGTVPVDLGGKLFEFPSLNIFNDVPVG